MNAFVAFFPLAKLAANLLAARKITTYVIILGSHPAIHAAQGILPRAASFGTPKDDAGFQDFVRVSELLYRGVAQSVVARRARAQRWPRSVACAALTSFAVSDSGDGATPNLRRTREQPFLTPRR